MTTLDAVIRAVAARHDVSVEELANGQHSLRVARARHIVMWLAERVTERSRLEIGAALGRDHTTVTYGVANVWQRLTDGDADLERELAELMERLRSDAPPPEAAAAAVAEIDAAIEALQRARAELISAHAPPLHGTPEKRIDRDAQLIRAAARERGRLARKDRPRRLPAEDART